MEERTLEEKEAEWVLSYAATDPVGRPLSAGFGVCVTISSWLPALLLVSWAAYAADYTT